MAKLWLTYAWKDNEENDVDHIVSQLTAAGIDVHLDRVQLLAGRRLWQQIDRNIRNPDVAAWAIYTTEASLKSEPCQEELAYALDRTLQSKDAEFPLIGLFSGSFDRALIPSALATRLCVNLHENNWVEQVSDAIQGVSSAVITPPVPFGFKLHKNEIGRVLEVWPRTGTWTPTLAVVQESDRDCLGGISAGPRGIIDAIALIECGNGTQNGLYGWVMNNPVNSATTAKILLHRLPEWIDFGQQGGPSNLHRITFDLDSGED